MTRRSDKQPTRLVVMGVSGSGKSTVARALADRLSLPFVEGDELHPQANVEKMTQGIPLTDDDRWPWLYKIAEVLNAPDAGVVVSCSALKRSYRDRLRQGAPVTFLFLDIDADTLSKRLLSRKGHFMKQSMLDSQLATLERPQGEPLVLTCRTSESIGDIVSKATDWLDGQGSP